MKSTTYDEFIKTDKGKAYVKNPAGETPAIKGVTYDEFLKSPKGKAYAAGSPTGAPAEEAEPAAEGSKKEPVKAASKKASD